MEDKLGVAVLIAFIVVMTTAIVASVRSQKELRRNLEKSGRLVKSEDGREYELGKAEAFGHEYITFSKSASAFGVVHSPDCPCHGADKCESGREQPPYEERGESNDE